MLLVLSVRSKLKRLLRKMKWDSGEMILNFNITLTFIEHINLTFLIGVGEREREREEER